VSYQDWAFICSFATVTGFVAYFAGLLIWGLAYRAGACGRFRPLGPPLWTAMAAFGIAFVVMALVGYSIQGVA
jgi:hypothetical protein